MYSLLYGRSCTLILSWSALKQVLLLWKLSLLGKIYVSIAFLLFITLKKWDLLSLHIYFLFVCFILFCTFLHILLHFSENPGKDKDTKNIKHHMKTTIFLEQNHIFRMHLDHVLIISDRHLKPSGINTFSNWGAVLFKAYFFVQQFNRNNSWIRLKNND